MSEIYMRRRHLGTTLLSPYKIRFTTMQMAEGEMI